MKRRTSDVFPLTNIARAVELAPVHAGSIMDSRIGTTTALEVPQVFWLNDQWDKELREDMRTHDNRY